MVINKISLKYKNFLSCNICCKKFNYIFIVMGVYSLKIKIN